MHDEVSGEGGAWLKSHGLVPNGMTTDWREGWVDDDQEGIHEPGILWV